MLVILAVRHSVKHPGAQGGLLGTPSIHLITEVEGCPATYGQQGCGGLHPKACWHQKSPTREESSPSSGLGTVT